MFDVTDTYKTLIKQPTRYVGISGAVKLRSGTVVQFTDKNIVSGSLSITDRLNRRGDFRPGGVYSSGLSIGFTGLFARTNDLDGAVIRLNYLIYPNAEMKASEAQAVPLGRFYVDGSTIKRSGSTVRLKADDGLMLFDVPTTERSGTLYELVTGACAAAGVGFAMSQEEFEALPNATLSAAINTARIQNERDLLMYVGMITGSFARIMRSALALEFVPLTCEKDDSTHMIIPVREIAGNIRFSTDFSDDTTRIAKIFMRRDGTALYSSYTVTAGGSEKLATLELDENPLLSALTDDEVKTALNNLLAQLYLCLNRVFDAEFTGDPALEVGDYVRLRGGEIDTDRGYATGMITSQTWTYHGTHRIKCSMPSSLVYSGDAETAAVMALADDGETTTTAPERVQPKSQIEKRMDAIEAGMNGSGNSASALTSYEYLTNLSAKCNGVTYTIEKDDTTGLISKISDSNGNSFEPTINSGITDIALHNAVFWAAAMIKGFGSVVPVDPTGTYAIFLPESIDIANMLWRDSLGEHDMTLYGSPIKSYGGVYLSGNNCYGKVSIDEPLTIYAIFKGSRSSNHWTPVVCKGTNGTNNASFDIFLSGSNISGTSNDNDGNCVSSVTSSDWHVVCITRSAFNTSNAKLYVDGVLVGSFTATPIYYVGYYTINNAFRGDWFNNAGNFAYKYLSFGSLEHTAAQVVDNTTKLQERYLNTSEQTIEFIPGGIDITNMLWHDRLGNYDMTLYGSPTSNDGGLRLSGTSSYGKVFIDEPLTIYVVFKGSGTYKWTPVVCKCVTTGKYGDCFDVFITSGNISGTGYGSDMVSSVASSDWHVACITRSSSGDAKLYVDGALVGSFMATLINYVGYYMINNTYRGSMINESGDVTFRYLSFSSEQHTAEQVASNSTTLINNYCT